MHRVGENGTASALTCHAVRTGPIGVLKEQHPQNVKETACFVGVAALTMRAPFGINAVGKRGADVGTSGRRCRYMFST